MKKIIFLAFILIQGHVIMVNAQNNKMFTRIKEQLNPSGQKSIAKAEKYYNKQEIEKKQAVQFEGSRKKKTLQKEIKASKYFGKANKICYNVFKEDLEKFRNTQSDSAKAIKKRLNRSKRLIKEAKDIRNESLKINVLKNEHSLLKHADELELKAFEDIYYVYAIFLGPLKKENIQIQETNNELSNSSELIEDPIVPRENAGLSKSVIATGIIADSEIPKSNEAKIQEKQNTLFKNEETTIDESNLQYVVYFKIQIAASKTQLSVDHLIKNFKTKEILNVEKEEEWYKYSIRKKFTDYDEALAYKNNLSIKGAFIIAFKNGKKVTIEEALKKDTPTLNLPFKMDEKEGNPGLEISAKITYKVQIGLSFNQLNPEDVRQFKNGGQLVTAHNCGSFFIYTVGDFETENAAINFKKLKGLSESEIVKFKNDKLVEE